MALDWLKDAHDYQVRAVELAAWAVEPDDPDWIESRLACVTAGLKAVIMEGGKNV